MIYINNNIFGGLDESKALIFVVDTSKIESGSSTNVQYKIPLQLKTGLYDVDCKYIIKWGDTTQSTITSSVDANLLHTYPFAGEYTIKIYPLSGASRISFFVNNLANRDRLKIREINQVGFAEIDSLYGCANMRAFTATDFSTYWNTKTDMSYMFAGWNTFNATLPSGFGNFPNATNMTGVFQGWWVYNTTLPAGFGSFANATNLYYTYYDWRVFNKALPAGFGVYPNATNLYYTYCEWFAFNQTLPAGFGIYPNATNITGTYADWRVFNQALPSGFGNYPLATAVIYAFQNWFAFNQALPSGFGNYPLATAVIYAFQGWYAFNQTLPSGFGNYPLATAVTNAFGAWLAFNQALPSGFGNYPLATNVSAAFGSWFAFNQTLPAGFGNFPLATAVNYAFQGWSAFNQSITLTTSASLTNIYQAFHSSIFKNITISNCTNVSTINIYTFNVVPLETLIVNNLKISFTIQYSTFTKTAYLDLIASLKDMTALTSPTMTVKNVPAFDTDCDNAAAAKNWTVVKI